MQASNARCAEEVLTVRGKLQRVHFSREIRQLPSQFARRCIIKFNSPEASHGNSWCGRRPGDRGNGQLIEPCGWDFRNHKFCGSWHITLRADRTRFNPSRDELKLFFRGAFHFIRRHRRFFLSTNQSPQMTTIDGGGEYRGA